MGNDEARGAQSTRHWLGLGLAVIAPHRTGLLLAAALAAGVAHANAQEAMRGVLRAQAAVPMARAQRECLPFPVDPPNDRLQGPHGDTLVSARCVVASFGDPTSKSSRWIAAHYTWVSIFTAEDASRSADARDTVTEEEAVLFEVVSPERVRPVWHARIDSGPFGVWRSVTPEIVSAVHQTVLLSVMTCLNGTGGCTQEFLNRHADGRWFPVRQAWLDQLPAGFRGRIRHGVRIDPRTLRAEAGFYGDADPNCCPSETLTADLALQADMLVLRAPPSVHPSGLTQPFGGSRRPITP